MAHSFRKLSHGPFPTPDPFLFCVYHKDAYPAGNARMGVNERGNGHDFDPSKPYRLYHAEGGYAGFPSHPHRGFETLTATIDGLIDHADSMGNAARYGHGDLQWLTAGKGICHSEMFPLVHKAKPNPTRFFQIWLNLPPASKMADPAFVMHWGEEIPKWSAEDGSAQVTVWAGEFGGKTALRPTPDSWAASPENDVAVFHMSLRAGASLTLPAARGAARTKRSLYMVEGDAATVAGTRMPRGDVVGLAELDASEDVEISASEGAVEFLLLQGKPIGAPVAQHGPFVMNTREEIAEAFSDYRRTQFGGWPWDQSGVVFPREKQRFAKVGEDEMVPPIGAEATKDEL